MSNEICPAIEGIGGMTDMEVFSCFNVEIDGDGNDLWDFRRFNKKRKLLENLKPT